MSAEVFKTLIAGPPNSGKTSLIKAYLGKGFQTDYTATVGVMMDVAQMELPEGKVVLSLIDLGGQQSFRGLGGRFYKGAHHLILVYDVTKRESLKDVADWYTTLTEGICMPSEDPFGGSLVGNKIDLVDKIEIEPEEGKQMAGLLSLDFFLTSAKTGTGVAEVFINAGTASRMRARQAADSFLRPGV
ncbi:MAG: Rab family GTPase [Candidatus Thorarchaeota archaeon]|jgi:Ras-related protein Rab-1A